jgi:DNA-directed RNA polymerase subunit RPC12/RpoP
MKKRYDEQIVQTFPHRCPYCDEPIAYDHLDLKKGENPIQCPSCHRKFIKVVPDLDRGRENL